MKRKIALCFVGLMLVTSFIGICSTECTAAPMTDPLTPITGTAITIVTGLFFDVQQSMGTTSFYAVRIHYWTIGPLRHDRGVISLRSCTGGMIIGPILLLKIGPLHNFMFGTFALLGDIQYIKGSFGQGFTS